MPEARAMTLTRPIGTGTGGAPAPVSCPSRAPTPLSFPCGTGAFPVA